MISCWRKCKEIERKSIGAKTEQKQGKNRGLRDFAASANLTLWCEPVSQPKRSRCGINVSLRKWPSFAKSFRRSIDSSAKIFAAAKRLQSYKVWKFPISQPKLHLAGYFEAAKLILAHECHFAAQWPPFRSCEMVCEIDLLLRNPLFAAKSTFFCETQNDL